jgi:hypothetical protein
MVAPKGRASSLHEEKLMKLEAPENPNYAATIVRIRAIIDPLPNSDNLVGVPVMGMQAVVGRGDFQVGDLAVLLPTECQLSEEFARLNNLHRHAELNDDTEKPGYLEDNRRVRAIRLRGNVSNALVLPISCLNYTAHGDFFDESDVFDKLGDHEICRKYVIKTREPRGMQARTKTEPRVDAKLFPEHFDSPNYFRVDRTIDREAHAVVTQKLHGTSIRIGNTLVKRDLTLVERLLKRFGVRVQETEYAPVYGSRKVIKDANNPNQNHFYDHDLWSEYGKKLDGLVPEGYIVYGELIGWAGESPIQKNYTYHLGRGACELYVYRVATVNPKGVTSDLSWEAVKQFCAENGLKHVPELWNGPTYEVPELLEELLDTKFYGDDVLLEGAWLYLSRALPLAPTSPCDEGVCIRIEARVPEIYKAKSPAFLEHETKLLDKGEEDLESAEAAG